MNVTVDTLLIMQGIGTVAVLPHLVREFRRELRWKRRIRATPRGWRRRQVRIQVNAERATLKATNQVGWWGSGGRLLFDPHWTKVRS